MSKVLIVFLALLSILALLTGCTQTASPTATPPGYPPPSSTNVAAGTGYPAPTSPAETSSNPEPTAYPAGTTAGTGSLQIVASDGTIKGVSLADLNDLPKATVGSESGPKLTDVLQFANIFDFATVTVTGSSGAKDLTKADVTDQVILALANNSVSLVIGGQNDPAVQGVTTIVVK